MIVVFGSINTDLVMTVPALPRPGETVLAEGYLTKPGGKGANQAVAAARAGAKVAMAGAVGADAFGQAARDNLRANGVDVGNIATVRAPSGIAFICVDPAGENAIAVGAGANLLAQADQVPAALLTPAMLVMMQMEVAPEQNWRLAERARAAGARTLLNAAPAGDVPPTALVRLDYLVVNEHEALVVAARLGAAHDTVETAALALAALGPVTVVTMGGVGAIAAAGEALWQVPGLEIEPVDTTGAGDAFTGAFAAAIDGGAQLPDALARAAVAGGLACLALGAQESLPTAAAIAAALPRLGPAQRSR